MKRAALVVLAACGGAKPPEVAYNEADKPAHVAPRCPTLSSAARPELDFSFLIPDPTDLARWPLAASVHPVLEPHFAIAAVLAQPGVTWTDLCAMGAQNRHLSGAQDPVEYLRAWCDAQRHDVEAAVRELYHLENSPVLGLASALPIDCANILADAGPGKEAARLLYKAGIVKAEVYDNLSATYFEIGKLGDAYEIAELAVEAGSKRVEDHCHQLAKSLVIAQELGFTSSAKIVGDLKRQPNPTCSLIDHELTCWMDPGTGCAEYLHDVQSDQNYADLLRIYYHWPQQADAESWLARAEKISGNLQLTGADQLVVTALEAAVIASSCKSKYLSEVYSLAIKIPSQDPTIRKRVEALQDLNATKCKPQLSDCQ